MSNDMSYSAMGHSIEPNITFFGGDPSTEVLRIDKHGIKVTPGVPVDEAAQHVIAALEHYIQHVVRHAVAEEREACAKVCETEWSNLGQMEASLVFAAAIRARGQQ